MSDAERFDDDLGPKQRGASNSREEGDDNIGNRLQPDAHAHLDDDFGNRAPPDEAAAMPDDDIGNRHSAARGRGDEGPGGRGRRPRRRREARDGREPRESRGGRGGRSGGPRAERGEPVVYQLKSDPEEKRSAAEQVCTEIVRHSGREAEVKAELTEENGQPKVVVLVDEKGPGSPLFTRNSAALSSLNFLTNKIVNRFPDDRIRLVVHVLGGAPPSSGRGLAELSPEEEEVKAMALELAAQATRMNKALSVAPMRSDMRRIVHLTLESHPDVVTMSEGEGNFRKLIIAPRAMVGGSEARRETPQTEAP